MNNIYRNENLIHKYYPPSEYSLDTLMNHFFWFSKREFLNDPFDLGNFRKGKRILEAQQTLISNIITKFGYDNEIEKKLLSQLPEYASCSFTKSPLNKQMWAYYAKDYSGWCLSFNANGNLKTRNPTQLLPVIYVDSNMKTEKPVDDNIYGSNPFEQAVNQVLCTKHLTWKYEDEYRMVLQLKNEGNGQRRQWGTFHLEAITIGYKIADPYRDILTLLAKNMRIPIFEIELSESDFELTVKQIL